MRGSHLGLLSLVTVGAALAVAGLAGNLLTAQAQANVTIQMAPTAGREPGLAGATTISPAGANQVKVDIRITGLKPNDERASHIHSPGTGAGPCDSGGPVVYPLTNVKADASGVGTSSTTITLDATKGIPTARWYVNVHEGAAPNVGNGVICGAITAALVSAAASPAAGAGGAAAANGPAGLPTTGDAVPMGTLFAALAGLGVVIAGAGVLVRRRRA